MDALGAVIEAVNEAGAPKAKVTDIKPGKGIAITLKIEVKDPGIAQSLKDCADALTKLTSDPQLVKDMLEVAQSLVGTSVLHQRFEALSDSDAVKCQECGNMNDPLEDKCDVCDAKLHKEGTEPTK